MIGHIITIGTELTRGELTDTNGSWLAAQMLGCGTEVTGLTTVDDDLDRIADALQRASSQSDVVICTGGLGPTTDDRTCEAAARAAGVETFRDEPTIAAIRQRFEAIGLAMAPNNEKQAEFPQGATVLPNPVGTAPGFFLPLGRARVYFFPGVPYEMKRLFGDHTAEWLRERATGGLHQRALRCFGTGESNIGAMLDGVETQFPGVTIGYRATFPEVEVKVLARAETPEEAEALCTRALAEVRGRLGHVVFAEGQVRMAQVVVEHLRSAGRKLVLAESCTGGLIAHLLTEVPGASDVLLCGVVTYSNASKERLLGVSPETIARHGAVSAETVREMARGALALCDADLAVATSGVAGPTGGTADKPVGLVHFALAERAKPEVRLVERKLRGDRARVQMLAAYVALKMILTACGLGEAAA